MTRGVFSQHMARLSAAYRQDLTQATLAVYYEILGAFDDVHLDAAVTWTLTHSQFLPTPAALLERTKHERQQRPRHLALVPPPLRALDPAPDWVTEDDRPDVKALISELLPRLTAAEATVTHSTPARPTLPPTPHNDPHNEAHLPHDRGTAADLDWRAGRAAMAIASLRQYCDTHRIDWHTGKDLS